MKKPLIVRAEAEDDLEDAFRWEKIIRPLFFAACHRKKGENIMNINDLSMKNRVYILIGIIILAVLGANLFSPYRISLRGSKSAALEYVKSDCSSFAFETKFSDNKNNKIQCDKYDVSITKTIPLTEANKQNNIQSIICVVVKFVYKVNDSAWKDQEVGLLVVKRNGEFTFIQDSLSMACDPNLLKIGM